MPELDQWMQQIAKAAYESDADNFVFVMRRVLTDTWQNGFEAGLTAADRDRYTVRRVEKIAAEAKERADA